MKSSEGVSSRPPLRAEPPYLVRRRCDCFAWFQVPYWSDRNECDTCLIRGLPLQDGGKPL